VISNDSIQKLAEAHLNGSGKFVTKITVSASNRIEVLMDGDDGISIQDCVDLSRHIEKSLDRDKEDFSLEVSSPGAAAPLVIPRQYKKHIGRTLSVKLKDDTEVEGELKQLHEKGFVLEYSARENKSLGKGKVTVVKQHDVLFEHIKESKIKLKF
jgi:ribosome maturation factor RimP